MAVRNVDQPTTLFAQKVLQRMEELNLGTIDVSDKTGATYQHIRGIVKGDSFPSPYFLRILCDVLGLDSLEMNKLLAVDKIKHKFGELPELLTGKDPSLAPVEQAWKSLNREQRDELIKRAKDLERLNRRAS